jgi:hypothetical protein
MTEPTPSVVEVTTREWKPAQGREGTYEDKTYKVQAANFYAQQRDATDSILVLEDEEGATVALFKNWDHAASAGKLTAPLPDAVDDALDAGTADVNK